MTVMMTPPRARRNAHWMIVGAGFTGATLAERIATELGHTVTVVDRRDHIGGNAHDAPDASGILVHKYGPHIFHTNSKKIWDYLSRFTEWRPYFHRVLASVDGQEIPLPFNYNSMRALFSKTMAEGLFAKLVERFGFGARVPIMKLRAGEDPELRFLADYVYDKVFLNYTRKQWDLEPEELDPAVTARVPILVNRDDRYFQDRYQAMPLNGYSAMFARMLDHPNIRVELGVDFGGIAAADRPEQVIFTGQIDEYFDFRHGELPYRSIDFVRRTEPVERFQKTSVVNYPNDFDFTRITEQKYLSGQRGINATTLIYEYPRAWKRGENEPYYPVPIPATRGMLGEYERAAEALRGRVFFAGRLADYRYYNMDQAVGRALTLFEREIR